MLWSFLLWYPDTSNRQCTVSYRIQYLYVKFVSLPYPRNAPVVSLPYLGIIPFLSYPSLRIYTHTRHLNFQHYTTQKSIDLSVVTNMWTHIRHVEHSFCDSGKIWFLCFEIWWTVKDRLQISVPLLHQNLLFFLRSILLKFMVLEELEMWCTSLLYIKALYMILCACVCARKTCFAEVAMLFACCGVVRLPLKSCCSICLLQCCKPYF